MNRPFELKNILRTSSVQMSLVWDTAHPGHIHVNGICVLVLKMKYSEILPVSVKDKYKWLLNV